MAIAVVSRLRRGLPWAVVLLGTALAALWLRSRWTYDRIDFGYVARYGQLQRTVIWAELASFRGRCSILIGGGAAFRPRAGLPRDAEGSVLYRHEQSDVARMRPHWAHTYSRGFLGFRPLSYERWPTADEDPVHAAYGVVLPHWTLVLLCVAWPSGRALLRLRNSTRRAGQAARALCPTCGYDLRATPGRCPECGKSAAPTTSCPGAKSEPEPELPARAAAR
jgi:hypothetical protein